MAAGLLYSLVRLLLDVASTSRREHAELRAEVLVLRRQVQVLERQIKRVRWSPADRMILAALRERLPRTTWGVQLVRPETVLGWHRDLVRRKWAAYGQRPRRGRPQLAEECRELIIRMARENPNLGLFPDPRGVDQAWKDDFGDGGPLRAEAGASSASWSEVRAFLEAVSGSPRSNVGGPLTSSASTRCS